MKILVIFTGGTIGSAVSDGWLAPDSRRSYLLVERYKKAHPASAVSFETLEPYSVLSENLSSCHLNALISCVTENAAKGYDGIIVTHGTDTLQYSAAAIGFALGAALPVVMVSSNFELEDPRTNGDENFAAAVELIRAGEKGVFAAYRNNDGVTYYHHASRLLRHGEANDDVHSLLQPYGVYRDGRFEKNVGFWHTEAGAPLGAFALCEHPGILNVFCHPGDSFRYELSGVRAVLLQPYHSGTLNTESADFAAFCGEASKRGIPVFLANVASGTAYSSAKNLDALGIIRLPLCGAIPVYMKLWLAISTGAELTAFAQMPIYEEFV